MRTKQHTTRRLGLVLACAAITFAEAPTLRAQEIEWVRQFGTTSSDVAYAVSLNPWGVYVAGYTGGDLAGYGSAGHYDAFVRKYDYSGNEQWTRQFGSANPDTARATCSDTTGVYVAGSIWTNNPDAYVKKFDSLGNNVWTDQFEAPMPTGIHPSDYAYGICMDFTGLYVVGTTTGTFPGYSNASGLDAFVRKYGLNEFGSIANESWTLQWGNDFHVQAVGVTTDNTGVYVVGYIWLGTQDYDAFVKKYDFDGNELWSRQFGDSSFDSARTICSDATGVYVAGITYGALPGQTSRGSSDAYVRKYDSDGNELWTRQFGSVLTDDANGIVLDSTGVYVAGATFGLSGLPTAGQNDAFVRKYDFAGNEQWTSLVGTAGHDSALGICVDSTGLYLAGNTSTGTFPGQVSSGGGDAFLAKLSLGPNQSPVAEAGSDQAVHPGDVVNLDGSGSSDPDGDYPLTYAWQLVSSPPDSAADLLNDDMVSPAFVPDRMGDYLIELIVTDSKGRESPPNTVVISTYNTAPVAAAGPDQALLVRNSTVQLNGTQSYDDEGDPFFYEWAFVQRPDGSQAVLSNAASGAPTFVADLYGDYVIRLTAIDIFGAESEPDDVTVSFTNVNPVADAGGNQAVVVLQTVILDGGGSSDANGDPLAFSWSFVTKPDDSQAALAAPGAVQTSFRPDLPGTYVVSLVVDDGLINSDPSNVTIEVITQQDAIAAKLMELIARINALPDDAFKNSNMRHALTNKVNAALSMLENEGYAAVLSKLESDLLPKTDGCALDGAPDANDWITDCASQAQIHPLIVEIIEMLW